MATPTLHDPNPDHYDPGERPAANLPVVVPAEPSLPDILDRKIERATAYANAARSAATRKAYAVDFH